MKKKVFMVEDTAVVRDFYQSFLSNLGFEVVEVSFFREEGFAEFFNEERDGMALVISDGWLGEDSFTGVDVVRLVRSLDSLIPIFAVTSDSDLAKKMVIAGADRFFHKPFNVEEFVSEMKVRGIIE